MPDELLGRGFININDLAFEPLEVRGWSVEGTGLFTGL
jgi:hypothetical protein